jgi:hypothetical protein
VFRIRNRICIRWPPGSVFGPRSLQKELKNKVKTEVKMTYLGLKRITSIKSNVIGIKMVYCDFIFTKI